jgi:cytochrome oxidase Cu insertion factor (SCO1/SenC/PrrC family)
VAILIGVAWVTLNGLGALAHGVEGGNDRVELSFGRSADYDYDPPALGSYRLPVITRAADGEVVGSNGRAHRLADLFGGRITVLSFIYTRCADPNGCPAAVGLLRDLSYANAQDPELARNVSLLSLSFDPSHDTPEVMSEFAGAHGGDGDWRFLTTRSSEALAPILTAYGQAVGAKVNSEDPFGPYTHQLRLFLIDRRGMVRNIYSLGFLDPRLVITDIRTLLLEERMVGATR